MSLGASLECVARIDPNDSLEAFEKREQFRHGSDEELAAWLRTILAHNLADLLRAFGRAKRNLALEKSLEAALGDSSSRLEGWLAAEQSSPSQRAMKEEQLLRLADALDQLPAPQREAVVLHYLQGMSLAGLASHLGRSQASAAGLLRRGLGKLREVLRNEN